MTARRGRYLLPGDRLAPPAYDAVYQDAANKVLARHDWHLLTADEIAAQAVVVASHAPASTAAHAERVCQQVYAEHLFVAAQDPRRQEAAYRELHAYLYRIALHQRPDLAEDAAQEAILLVYQRIQTCRSAGAFLKFAIYQLLTAFHRLSPSHREVFQDAAPDGSEPVSDAADMETVAVERAEAAHLLRWLHTVIEENPRAHTQLLAVAMKYLEGWEDETIAQALGTDVENVYVLRSRGLKKLRQEYARRFIAPRPH